MREVKINPRWLTALLLSVMTRMSTFLGAHLSHGQGGQIQLWARGADLASRWAGDEGSRGQSCPLLFLPLFILWTCLSKGLLIYKSEWQRLVSWVQSRGQDVRGSGNDVSKARVLRASYCSLRSGRLVAREDSSTLRCPGLQLAREQLDTGHRRMQESLHCL